MVLLDGKNVSQKICAEVKDEVARFSKEIRLAIVIVGDNLASKKFIERKKKAAEEIGIDVRIHAFPDAVTTNELRMRLAEIVHEEKNTGVIIQLPLPPHLNTQYILNSIVPEKDVDVLSARAIGNFVIGKSPIFPAVVGAVKAFFDEYGIAYRNKYIVLVGAGKLVGKPLALWLLNEKATFSVIRSNTAHPEEFLQRADIIISGVGQPNLIRGEHIKEGAVVIDVGTTVQDGKVVGDIDFQSVSPRAAYCTPVPGGMGPVVVAMLLKNLVTLAQQQS